MSGRRVRIVTGVWGEWHIDTLLNWNLPSLLAPGNIPAMGQHCRPSLYLYTIERDRGRFENQPVLEALRRHCDVEIRVMEGADLSDPIALHKVPWVEQMAGARAAGDYVIFFHPDTVWSDGSFEFLGRQVALGRKAVFVYYLRVLFETVTDDLRRGLDSEGSLRVPARELLSIGLRHIHSLIVAYFRRSRFFPTHSEMVVWPVPDNGVVVRSLARETFLLDPARVQILGNSLIDEGVSAGDVTIVGDVDDLFVLSLATRGKDAEWHDVPRQCDFSILARWWLTYDSSHNDAVADVPNVWCVDKEAASVRRRVTASAMFVAKLRAIRESKRVLEAIVGRMAGCEIACAVISKLIESGLVARVFGSELTDIRLAIFVPKDDVARSIAPQILQAIERKNVAVLRQALGSYVVFSEDVEKLGDAADVIRGGLVRTMSGNDVHLARVDGRLSFGRFVVDQSVAASGGRVICHRIANRRHRPVRRAVGKLCRVLITRWERGARRDCRREGYRAR